MEKIYEIVRIKQEVMETSKNRYIIKSPEDAVDHAYDLIGEEDREVFLVMVLNTKNHVVAVHRCHVGSLNASIVHPREIYKSAIMNNGAGILAIHQHPSGDPKESTEDIHVCRRLDEAGKILGIQLIDFCTIGEKVGSYVKYVSFKEKGYL
jgi:DNA repair protein RadC